LNSGKELRSSGFLPRHPKNLGYSMKSMILGVMSDVHANIHALKATWAAFQARGVTHTICLGDLVGYGASPLEVIGFMRDNNIPTTLGASDARIAFELSENIESRTGVADQTLVWTKTQIGESEMRYMRQLKVVERLQTPRGRLKFFHGLPDDPDGRLDLQVHMTELDAQLEGLNASIIISGGTHIPAIQRTKNGVFINPGSVGLSLNGEPGADCAIIEFGLRPEVDLLKVKYDYQAAAFDILTWGLPPVIADVIKAGSANPGNSKR
jgi:putative phosphoesterase